MPLYYIVLFLLIAPVTLLGQWERTWTFPSTVRCIYDGNEHSSSNMFVGLANGEIWKSTDRGYFWSKTIILNPSSNSDISEIVFKDRFVGWSSHRGEYGGCYKTTDGGNTWQEVLSNYPIGPRYNATAVHYNPSSKLLFVSSWETALVQSNDDGNTWKNFLQPGGNGFIFFDSNNGAVTTADKSDIYWYVTNDGGFTWSKKQKQEETWQPVALAQSSSGFALSDFTSNIYQTLDKGETWVKKFTFPSSNDSYSGTIRTGSCNQLYVHGVNGIEVSGDMSSTWIQIYGPPFPGLDIRFTVCNDTVFAQDAQEGLWKYLPLNSLSLLTDSISVVAHTCSVLDTAITLINTTCESITIDSVTCDNTSVINPQLLGGTTVSMFSKAKLNISTYSNTPDSISTNVHIYYSIKGNKKDTIIFVKVIVKNNVDFLQIAPSKISFPATLVCEQNDTTITIKNNSCDTLLLTDLALSDNVNFSTASLQLPFKIFPGDSASIRLFSKPANPGIYNAVVSVTVTQGAKSHLTFISLSVEGMKNDSLISISDSLVNFGKVLVCDSNKRTVKVTNNSCDSVLLELLDLPISVFKILEPKTPTWIAEGGSIDLVIQFEPGLAGTDQSYLNMGFKQQGKPDLKKLLYFEGVHINELPSFNIEPAYISFDTLPLCSEVSDTISFTITNNATCSSLKIDSVMVTGAEFNILDQTTNTFLTPGQSIKYYISFTPIKEGDFSGFIKVFHSNNKDSLVTLNGYARYQGRTLSVVPNNIDFGSRPVCENFDTVINFKNEGCDTIHISVMNPEGGGFSSGVVTPIIIPPGSIVKIPVTTKGDTSQGNVSTGTITIASDADNQIAPITLSRSYTYPKSYSFHIGMLDETATSDEIVHLAIVGEQGLGSVGTGVNRLDFDLLLNEDLLEYIRPEGTNTVSKNGSRISILNQNELTSIDDTLAILVYHVFLTKDSVTDITVSNTTINNGDTSSCAPKIAATPQTGFTYSYECGDRQIQSYLRTGQASLEIISIRPNPAKDEMNITLLSENNIIADISIVDINGIVVQQTHQNVRTGSQDIHVRLSTLTSGSYTLLIKYGNQIVSDKFTIHR